MLKGMLKNHVKCGFEIKKSANRKRTVRFAY